MKRSGFDINEIKNGFCIAVTITASVVWLGACGNTNIGSQQPVQPTQTTEVTVEPTVDPVEVDPVEPTVDPVEPEEFTVSAEDVINLVEVQSESHPQVMKEQVLAFVMSLNFDDITEENRDIIMNTYGVSYEDLDFYLRTFYAVNSQVVDESKLYHFGFADSLDPNNDIQNWFKYSELVLNPANAELCESVDEYFTSYKFASELFSIDSTENSLNYTLFYVVDPVETMEDSVFTQYVNGNDK